MKIQKKKDIKKRDLFTKEINIILKNSFNIEKNKELPDVFAYFIDTDTDENDDGDIFFLQKSQDTLDIIIKRIVVNYEENKSLDTSNLDFNKESVQKRMEEEKKILLDKIKRLEEEKKEIRFKEKKK